MSSSHAANPIRFIRTGRRSRCRLLDIDRPSARLGVVRHGGGAQPVSTIICGNFTVSRPLCGAVLELLPPVLLLKPTADGGWLEAILRRMVSELALERPGQGVALSRLTEVLFVEVLRSWIKSLSPGEGGWLGAMADPHIGPALRLIHEQLDRPWSLRELGLRVGLGRSAFSARFTKLVGQPMHRYLIAHRMMEAAFLLESSDEPIATDRESSGLRDRCRVFEAVPSPSRLIAGPLPSNALRPRPKLKTTGSKRDARGIRGLRGCQQFLVYTRRLCYTFHLAESVSCERRMDERAGENGACDRTGPQPARELEKRSNFLFQTLETN